jgi:hypothetical protein
MYQQRYWNQLKELKVHVFYLQNYAVSSGRFEQVVNVVLAIASSSSIGAWIIWKEYQLVWASIIAISQVITAVKPILPFKKRLEAVSNLGDRIAEISLEAEKDWFFVAEGKWTEQEIHEKCIALKQDALEAERKFLKGMILPKSSSALSKAEREADLYLSVTY